MELPVARQPGQKASPNATIRAIKRAEAILARMTAEETYLDGATVYSSTERPLVPSANSAYDLRLPTGVAAKTVLDAVWAHYAAKKLSVYSLDSSDAVWPAELAAEIERRGGRREQLEVHQLTHYVPPPVQAGIEVIPGRAAYGELRELFVKREFNPYAEPEIASQTAAAMLDQLDDPRVDIFLARAERKPIGVASLLTLGNIGVVISIFGDPRVVGLGSTLAARLFDHCVRAQFEQVIVRLRAGEPDAAFFTALGFKKVAEYVRYDVSQA